MKPDESKKILNFFKEYFSGDLSLLNYEMIKPNDPFGRVMLENLEVINIYNFCRIEDADFRVLMSVRTRLANAKD